VLHADGRRDTGQTTAPSQPRKTRGRHPKQQRQHVQRPWGTKNCWKSLCGSAGMSVRRVGGTMSRSAGDRKCLLWLLPCASPSVPLGSQFSDKVFAFSLSYSTAPLLGCDSCLLVTPRATNQPWLPNLPNFLVWNLHPRDQMSK
jgi:hypothetical protein